ncbi:MAG: biosynthetic peptidoglycan transglycosylase [Polyangiales bacterium]
MVIVAPLVLLPMLLRSRAESALSARTGLAAKVDSVSLATAGATLHGIHLTPPEGAGVKIDVETATADFGWVSALVSGTDAVTGVRADGITAQVDIASDAFAELKQKLTNKPASESSGDTGGSKRTAEVKTFALDVTEGDTELLSVHGTSAQLLATQIKADLKRVHATKPGLASVAMNDVKVTLLRGGGLRLSELRVDEARVAIETPVGLTGVAAAPDKDTDTDENAATDDSQPAGVAKVALVNADGSSRQESLKKLLSRFTPDAELEVVRGRIEQVSGSEKLPILNDVSAQISLQPDGAVRVNGKGAAKAGGKLNVDMRFWPEDLRADGRVALTALPLTLFVPILPSVPWYAPEKSRINAELTIKAESPARVALDGYADLRNVSLSADRLATSPVEGISLSIAGRGQWLPVARRLEIDSGSFGLGRARADVKGAVEWASDHYAFDVAANLPATPCTDAVRSIPSALLGDMALAQWRGNIAGKLRFQTDSRELDKTVLDFGVTDRCQFELVPVMADLSKFARPFTHSVTEPDGTLFEMETGPGTENWTAIEAMSPYFVHAVMVHEDPQFFNHRGFSPVNIRNALVRDLRERRYAVGASTISMQLVKNIFLHREKTLARKIQEVLLTWWTERVMEKRDILELYFNVIEYGPGIYGIRNAALHYWNRLPSELSPAEAVFLATILPNPKRFHTYYEKNALTSSWASGMRKFLQRLGDRGAYDQDAIAYGLQELEHFRFTKNGQAAAPRVIAGATAPLPYMQNVAVDPWDAKTFGSARRFD